MAIEDVLERARGSVVLCECNRGGSPCVQCETVAALAAEVRELRRDKARLDWLFAAKRAYLFAPSRHDKSVGRYLVDRDDIDAEMGGAGGA